MKNYNEIANDIFERREEYVAARREKRRSAVRITSAVCSFVLVALLGVGVWRSGLLSRGFLPVTDGTSDEDLSESNTGVEKPNVPVIWGNNSGGSENAGLVEWNGKRITDSLYNALRNYENENCAFAVSPILRYIDEEYEYNGKTIAEYESEAEEYRMTYYKFGELLKMGDSLKYGEALVSGAPNGEKWAEPLYNERIEYFGEDLLAKYIVDGEFLKEKVEEDMAEYAEYERIARESYDTARKAYFRYFADEVIKQLEKQNVSYERNSETDLTVFVSADEFITLSLDNVRDYGLAAKNGNDDLVYTCTC